MSDENIICQECQNRQMLGGDASLLNLSDVVEDDSPAVSPLSSPSHTLQGGTTAPRSPLGDASDDALTPAELTEDEDLESPTRRTRILSGALYVSEEEKEQLYVEARLKIYNAAKELRNSPNFERDGGDRKSLKKLLKKKKKMSQ